MNIFMDILAVLSGIVGALSIGGEFNNKFVPMRVRIISASFYAVIVAFSIIYLISGGING